MTTKFFDNTFENAAQLTASPGSAIAIFDSCLVTGFNPKAITSLTQSGGVATATIAAGHAMIPGQAILVAGAVDPSYNGEHVITAVTASTVQYLVSPTAASPDTGASITCKYAPLGWSKVFSGTNLAAYQYNDVQSNQRFLYVDDTGSTATKVIGYETMTAINAGSGLFPSTDQANGGFTWLKGEGAGSTTRRWDLFGDSRVFYWAPTYHIGSNVNSIVGFGDFNSYRPGDPYATFLVPHPPGYTVPSYGIETAMSHSYASTFADMVICRPIYGVGAPLWARKLAPRAGASGPTCSGNYGYYSTSYSMLFPNPANYGLELDPLEIMDITGTVRGKVPGVYHCPQALYNITAGISLSGFYHRQLVSGTGDYAGRSFKAISVNNNYYSYNGSGILFVDTGPWR